MHPKSSLCSPRVNSWSACSCWFTLWIIDVLSFSLHVRMLHVANANEIFRPFGWVMCQLCVPNEVRSTIVQPSEFIVCPQTFFCEYKNTTKYVIDFLATNSLRTDPLESLKNQDGDCSQNAIWYSAKQVLSPYAICNMSFKRPKLGLL